MRFDIVTLFPGMFTGFLSESLLKLAIQRDLLNVAVHDLRDWANDKHNKVDDRPYGGGPGMVIRVQPVVDCVEEISKLDSAPPRVILLSPAGRRLDQALVEELSQSPRLILLCGRYEGFDQRVLDILQPEEISIGDYVLNGGEVASMVIVESVMRLLPGALGDDRSARDDSFAREDGLLEGPQYTRPREYRGHEIPEILLSGDHGRIAAWRRQQSHERTLAARGDLLPTQEETTHPSKDKKS